MTTTGRCGCGQPTTVELVVYQGDSLVPAFRSSYCSRHGHEVLTDAHVRGFDVHARAVAT
jgi:hypothetical protein